MKFFGIGKILLIFTLFSGVFLQAEDTYKMEWVNQFDFAVGSFGENIAIDSSGNVVVIGVTNDTFTGKSSSGDKECRVIISNKGKESC